MLEEVSVLRCGVVGAGGAEEQTLPDETFTDMAVDGSAYVPKIQDGFKVVAVGPELHAAGRRHDHGESLRNSLLGYTLGSAEVKVVTACCPSPCDVPGGRLINRAYLKFNYRECDSISPRHLYKPHFNFLSCPPER